jgi:hypothetical protein
MVSLSGNANNLVTIAPTPGASLSATVTAGQTATFSLQLTSGFNGSVAFTCAGAPVSAACSVPTAISVTSGVTVPFVITVATTGNNTTGQLWRRPPDAPSGGPRSPYLLVLLYLLAGWALCTTVLKTVGYARGRGAHQRLAYGSGLVACAALALYTVAGAAGPARSHKALRSRKGCLPPPELQRLALRPRPHRRRDRLSPLSHRFN